MEISGITYLGPEVNDRAQFGSLPSELTRLLQSHNGFILYHGALHVRGVCSEPEWHSLHSAWQGESAFHKLYEKVLPEDIPFAQDCMGDQFLLREGHVLRLLAETGEIEGAAIDLSEFFAEIEKDPEEYLNYSPGHELEPGQLLHAFPPICVEPPDCGYSLKAVPVAEVIRFHADFAKRIAKVPDGESIKIRLAE